MKSLLTLVFFIFAYTYAQDVASDLFTKDICPDRSGSLKCDPTPNSNYTPIVVEALFGISSIESDLCEYTDGDCYGQSTSNYCQGPSDSCSIYPSTTNKVTNCQNQIADYLHIRYRCAPIYSGVINEYKICDTQAGDITDLKGFISSPNYPVYTMQTTACTRKISVPNNKIINLYIYNDFKIPSSDNDCKDDYLIITDNTGTYTTCGYKKIAFESQLCSSVVYLTYKATTNLSSIYRGFKLYYETVDRSTQPSCPTNTPSQPLTPPPPVTTPAPSITNLVATETKKNFVCKGTDYTIDTPNRFSLFPINYYYGVTSDFTCNTIGPQNCKSPAPFSCKTQGSCKISLTTSVTLKDCGNKLANYIGIEYKFIPMVSTSNFSVCDSSVINATTSTYGVITSVNYPTWLPNQNCNRVITAKHGRIIRVYVTDISIEGSGSTNLCQNGYLRFTSECDNVTYCGDKVSGGMYIYDSCSNTLNISYVSSSNSDLGYRGFNVYYEVMPEEKASVGIVKNVCTGTTVTVSCPSSSTTNYTAFVTEKYYAVKSTPLTNTSADCQYSANDCFGVPSDNYCSSPVASTCSIFTYTSETVPNCENKKANYFYGTYRCIPAFSTSINNYNVCDKTLSSITDANAFISSPNYPIYTQVGDECMQRIVAPKDKIIRLWIGADMKSSDSNNQCVTDYVQITDNTGTYKVCGYRKHVFEKNLCSSVIYVAYKAPADLSSIYRGFRLYYEFIDRSTQPDCPTNTPFSPTTPIPTTTTPQLIFDLAATQFNKTFICRGTSVSIRVPNNYNFFPIDAYYGVTAGQQCVNITTSDCKITATIDCSFQGTCVISYLNDVYLPSCGNVPATYLGVEYRFIPYNTVKNFTACGDLDLYFNQSAYGIMTSTNYPYWQPNQSCLRRLNAPPGFIIRVYINDFNIEDRDDSNGNCQNGFLKFNSDCAERTYCGEKSKTGNYVFESCTNTLGITYKSSSNGDTQYRGFNFYFEVVSSNAASLLTRDLCYGDSTYLRCDRDAKTNYTAFVSEALYGIKASPNTLGCTYTQGDCYDVASTSFCPTTSDSCYVYSSSTTSVTNCGGKRADYFHVRYRCVPASSSVIKSYDVCKSVFGIGLYDTAAFIRSPNYPTYTMVPDDCTVKIVAPNDKIIRMWVVLDMKSTDINDRCSSDYLMITDSTATYLVCGYRKVTFDTLCSSVIYVTYKAPANLGSLYKGFQIYYEFVDRSSSANCPTNTPASPTTPTTGSTSSTTPRSTTPKPFSVVLASDIYKKYVCRGSQANIDIPSGFSLAPINVYYGTTPDYTCNTINPQNCKSPAQLTCASQGTCTVALYSFINLDDCNGVVADYIGVEYRFIPLYSAANFTICSSENIDANKTRTGVITSDGYPNFMQNQNCRRQIIGPAGSYIRVFISDLNIENPDLDGQCQNGYLIFSSPCDDVKYCGSKTTSAGFKFESCSNVLTVSYVSSSNANPNYRGFNMYYEVTMPDKSSDPLQQDICAGDTKTIKCEKTPYTNFTILVSEAIYGIKNASSNPCALTTGDCYAASKSSFCTSVSDTCSAYSSSFTYVAKCDDKLANYLHLRYKCVPYQSTTIKEYNICDKMLSNITDTSGFITSPNFPTYTTVEQDCVQTIVVPEDQIINIWIPDIYMKDPESNNDCLTDYVKITHNTGTTKACGSKKYTFENRLCSSVVYLSYKAPTKGSFYKGFKLYYEVTRRSLQPNCPTGTPGTPATGIPTTVQPQILDLQATEITKAIVCRGDATTIKIKSNYVLFPIEIYYGVTSDGTCSTIGPQDCTAPAPFPDECTTDSDCELQLYNEIPVDDCSGSIATYIAMEYRFVPEYSLTNFSVCSHEAINSTYGVITSPNYPQWLPNQRCRTVINAPEDKVIRVYLTEISLEEADETYGNCSQSFVALISGNVATAYCGKKSESGNYVYSSCSNSLEIVYHSSALTTGYYRGFNLYFEVVDRININCPNVTRPTFTSRTTRHVTIIQDDHKHTSNKLIGWSLGLGIPALIALAIGLLYFIKRRNSTDTNTVSFQKMKNEETKSFQNPNF